jgi:hypothetical protein
MAASESGSMKNGFWYPKLLRYPKLLLEMMKQKPPTPYSASLETNQVVDINFIAINLKQASIATGTKDSPGGSSSGGGVNSAEIAMAAKMAEPALILDARSYCRFEAGKEDEPWRFRFPDVRRGRIAYSKCLLFNLLFDKHRYTGHFCCRAF